MELSGDQGFELGGTFREEAVPRADVTASGELVTPDEPAGRDAELEAVGPQAPEMPDWLKAELARAATHRDEIIDAPPEDANVSVDQMPQLADTDPVIIPELAELPIPQNVVAVPDEQHLRLAMLAQYPEGADHYLERFGMTVEQFIAREIAHERAHKEAAEALDQGGRLNGQYALELNPGGSFRPMYQSGGLETTAVGWAVMAVAPDPPSFGDTLHIQDAGYVNVQAVVDAAVANDTLLPPSLQKWVDRDATLQADWTIEKRLATLAEVPDRAHSYHEELNRAFAHAERVEQGNLVTIPGDLTNPDVPPGDDPLAPIHVPGRDEFIIPPHVVPSESVNGLQAVLNVGHPTIDHMRNTTKGSLDAQHYMGREAERLIVAASLGYDPRQAIFGLFFTTTQARHLELTYRLLTPGFETTRVGAALLNIGVTNPLPENYAAMRKLGFNSEAEVVATAKAAGLPIPDALRYPGRIG